MDLAPGDGTAGGVTGGVIPRLASAMLLGWDWTPIYDTLEWVWDTKMECRRIRNYDGWLREIDEDEGSADEADKFNSCDAACSPQFREAQEEGQELQAIKTQVLDTRNSQTEAPVGTLRCKGRNQLLYRVQKARMAEQEETVSSPCPVLPSAMEASPHGPYRGVLGPR